MYGILSIGYSVYMPFSALSFIASIHRSSNQGVDVEVASLTITSNNILGRILASYLCNNDLYWFGGKNDSCCLHNNSSIELEKETATGHFGVLMSLN